MDLEEVAKEILKATTLHVINSLRVELEKTDEAKNNALDNMKRAEIMLTDTLANFRQSILDEKE